MGGRSHVLLNRILSYRDQLQQVMLMTKGSTPIDDTSGKGHA